MLKWNTVPRKIPSGKSELLTLICLIFIMEEAACRDKSLKKPPL